MTYLTSGIILRASHFGDFDRQYVIYTKERGKIVALAKGVKKITSKLNSSLEFFNLCDLLLARGYAFDRVAGVQLIRNYSRGELQPLKVFAAYFYLETLDLLTDYNFPDEFSFHLTERFLWEIFSADSARPALLILNKFLFELLSHLGYRPRLVAATQKILLADLYQLIMVATDKPVKSFAPLLSFI